MSCSSIKVIKSQWQTNCTRSIVHLKISGVEESHKPAHRPSHETPFEIILFASEIFPRWLLV